MLSRPDRMATNIRKSLGVAGSQSTSWAPQRVGREGARSSARRAACTARPSAPEQAQQRVRECGRSVVLNKPVPSPCAAVGRHDTAEQQLRAPCCDGGTSRNEEERRAQHVQRARARPAVLPLILRIEFAKAGEASAAAAGRRWPRCSRSCVAGVGRGRHADVTLCYGPPQQRFTLPNICREA